MDTLIDDDDLGDIIFDGVRIGPSNYTQAPLTFGRLRPGYSGLRPGFWSAGTGRSGRRVWRGGSFAIARDETRAVGFMSLAPEGTIDFAYIPP
jgi:hypothetical protein